MLLGSDLSRRYCMILGTHARTHTSSWRWPHGTRCSMRDQTRKKEKNVYMCALAVNSFRRLVPLFDVICSIMPIMSVCIVVISMRLTLTRSCGPALMCQLLYSDCSIIVGQTDNIHYYVCLSVCVCVCVRVRFPFDWRWCEKSRHTNLHGKQIMIPKPLA